MAGNNRREWMRTGQLVRINGWAWFGEIIDVAETDQGGVMLLITSPKSVWHGHKPEWLEYLPGQIEPATAQEARRDIDLYLDRLAKARSEIESLAIRWAESK